MRLPITPGIGKTGPRRQPARGVPFPRLPVESADPADPEVFSDFACVVFPTRLASIPVAMIIYVIRVKV
jgi:hypothetical protein